MEAAKAQNWAVEPQEKKLNKSDNSNRCLGLEIYVTVNRLDKFCWEKFV
jgi:hypothetical protein